MRISDEMLYITDNGRTLCGEHLGASARFTGRDISGQPIEPMTPELVQEAISAFGWHPECEHCGRKASLLHAAV